MARSSLSWLLPIVAVVPVCAGIAWVTTPRPAPVAPATPPVVVAPVPAAGTGAPVDPVRAAPAGMAAAGSARAPAAPAPANVAGLPTAERHARLLGLERDATLVLVDENDRMPGMHHYRYEQAYRGLRVEGHNFVIHEPVNGGALDLSGEPILDFARTVPTIVPTLSTAQAMEIAVRSVMATHRGARIDQQDAALRICLDDARRPRLAYLVTIEGERPSDEDGPLGEAIAVDATDGRILSSTRTWDD